MRFCIPTLFALGSLMLNQASSREISFDEVKTYSDGFFERLLNQGELPGAVVSVVKDGSVVYKGGYGYSDLEELTPADPTNTVIQVGPISQSFTATSLFQLYENGRIDLNQNINHYFAGKGEKPEFFVMSNNYPGNVTAANLLTHTSGLDAKLLGTVTTRPQNITDSLVPALENFPIRIRDLNEAQSYSAHGYVLLGYAISKISDLPFTEYVRLNVLEPLGMNASTFAPHNTSDPVMMRLKSSKEYKFSKSYKKNENTGKFVRNPELYAGLIPAGSLASTADDISKFMITHLNHGKISENQHLLDSDTIEMMHSRQFAHHEFIDGTCYGFFETNFGEGLRMISQGGEMVGQSSQLSLFPEQNLGIFLSYNTNNNTIRKNFIEGFLNYFYEPSEEVSHYDEEFFRLVPHWDERASVYEAKYRPVGISHSTFEQLTALNQQIKVKGYPNNTLGIIIPKSLEPLFGTSEIRILEVAQHTFKVIDPISPGHMSKQYFAFKYDRGLGEATYLYAGAFDFPIVFERLDVHEGRTFQISVLIIACTIIAIQGIYYTICIVVSIVSGPPEPKAPIKKGNKKVEKKQTTKKLKKAKKAKDSDEEEEDDTIEQVQAQIEEEKRRQQRLEELRKKYIIPDDAVLEDFEKTEDNFSFQLLPHVPGVLAWLYFAFAGLVGYLIYSYGLAELAGYHRLPLLLRLAFLFPFLILMVTVAFAQHLFWWWGEIPGYRSQHTWFLIVLLASAVLLFFTVSYHLVMLNM